MTGNRKHRIDTDSYRAALWMALLVTLPWSSCWVLIRRGLDDEGLPPLTVAALRCGLAAVVLIGWVIAREGHRRHEYQVKGGFIIRLVVLSVVLYVLTQRALFVPSTSSRRPLPAWCCP